MIVTFKKGTYLLLGKMSFKIKFDDLAEKPVTKTLEKRLIDYFPKKPVEERKHPGLRTEDIFGYKPETSAEERKHPGLRAEDIFGYKPEIPVEEENHHRLTLEGIENMKYAPEVSDVQSTTTAAIVAVSNNQQITPCAEVKKTEEEPVVPEIAKTTNEWDYKRFEETVEKYKTSCLESNNPNPIKELDALLNTESNEVINPFIVRSIIRFAREYVEEYKTNPKETINLDYFHLIDNEKCELALAYAIVKKADKEINIPLKLKNIKESQQKQYF
jgi:hypothetical protein